MMTKILEFYDVPQLFLATDKFSSNYMCILTEFSPEIGYIYLAIQISEERLRDFLLGELDLRKIYLQPEVDDAYYKVKVRNQEITADVFCKNDIVESLLPDEGYYYEKDEEAENYELIVKTQQKQFTILRLGFVDKQNSHEIDSECLSQAMSAFQHLVSNCHQKLYGKQNAIEAKLRVTTFQAASFDVEFRSYSPIDLFGSSELSETLKTIDSLMSSTNEDDFKTILEQVQGRTVSSYKNFIRILDDNKLSIKYKWVSSVADKIVVSTAVPKERISQIYELLTRNNELELEEKEYIGIFLASSVENGRWTLHDDNKDKNINGESDTPSLLSGVTIESKKYKIKCRETQIQNVATLKTENKLTLISIIEIN